VSILLFLKNAWPLIRVRPICTTGAGRRVPKAEKNFAIFAKKKKKKSLRIIIDTYIQPPQDYYLFVMVSARKKKEKRKDFVKTKLRVGKDKPKANNHTDTSFVAKTISLPNQSINKRAADTKVPSGSTAGAGTLNSGLTAERLAHYLSLFKHHSSSTRKEALAYIQTQHIPYTTSNLKPVITSAAPLLTDSSASVRAASLDLLKTVPAAALAANAQLIALYINAAMTSIDPAVRAKATLALDLVVDTASEVVCRVAWTKILGSFMTLLGWSGDAASKRNGSGAAGFNNNNAMVVTTSLDFGSTKITVLHLQSLYKFLAAGVGVPAAEPGSLTPAAGAKNTFALKFLVPNTSMPYLSLNLFGNSAATGNKTSTITEDRESRIAVLQGYLDNLHYGLDQAQNEGGEPGRFAKQVKALLAALVD
jgi:pre-rRNA-processing protein IPI1